MKRCPQNSSPYIVRAGDTLFKIASRNRTTIEVLLELNPELNSNLLTPGISMFVPVEIAPPQMQQAIEDNHSKVTDNKKSFVTTVLPECNGMMKYTIKRDDTLYNIARKYEITLYDLLSANKDINPYNIQVGQIICIPSASINCPSGITYVVKEGDTLEKILTLYNITLIELTSLNEGYNPYEMTIGMKLCIPETMTNSKCITNRTYTVSDDDDLKRISTKLKISESELLIYNPNMRPLDFSKSGMKLCLPAEQIPYL